MFGTAIAIAAGLMTLGFGAAGFLVLIDRWRNGPYLAPIEDDDMPDMPLAAMPGERRGAA